jgi:hypothetical protein
MEADKLEEAARHLREGFMDLYNLAIDESIRHKVNRDSSMYQLDELLKCDLNAVLGVPQEAVIGTEEDFISKCWKVSATAENKE